MKSLVDYDILVNDVFYRSEHILGYIDRHKNMSKLDREALSNTILDALVDKGLMDPNVESLDLDRLAIVDNLDHKVYEEKPRVTSIPLELKEKMRSKALVITGGAPMSYFYAKPAGNVRFCIYDMNTAFSTLVDDCTFINCTYDSPTRDGIRTDNRPFVEFEYHGQLYYVDALTKRMFKKDWFDKEYNLEETYRTSKGAFDARQRAIYEEQTADNLSYASFIALIEPLVDSMCSVPKSAETAYEFAKSREYFPEEFEEAKKIKKECELFTKVFRKSTDKK